MEFAELCAGGRSVVCALADGTATCVLYMQLVDVLAGWSAAAAAASTCCAAR
eukprot:SAG25_NODE_398_length_8498_cov_16.527206_10_plen_52_part_00